MAASRIIWQHGVGFLLAIMLAPMVYMAFLDNRAPATVHTMALAGDFRPGGRVTVTFDATVHRDCTGYARRRITGSNGIVFEYEHLPTIIFDPLGMRRRFVREIELPLSISSGEATHDVQVIYYCNFVQRALGRPIVLNRPSIRFAVQ